MKYDKTKKIEELVTTYDSVVKQVNIDQNFVMGI